MGLNKTAFSYLEIRSARPFDMAADEPSCNLIVCFAFSVEQMCVITSGLVSKWL